MTNILHETQATFQPTETTQALKVIEAGVMQSLDRVQKYMDDDTEPSTKLGVLAHCIDELSLKDYVRSQRVEELCSQVPAVRELVEQMEILAARILSEDQPIASDSIIQALGTTADFTSNPGIIIDTFEHLEPVDGDKASIPRLAIEKAADEHIKFMDAKRKIERSQKKTPHKVERVLFDSASGVSYLNYYSPETSLSSLTGNSVALPNAVSITSLEEIYSDQQKNIKQKEIPDQDLPFTEQDAVKLRTLT